MKYFSDYKRVVATKEKSAGNESVGTMWTETKTFGKDEPIEAIIEWAKDADGKVILSIDESTVTEKRPF